MGVVVLSYKFCISRVFMFMVVRDILLLFGFRLKSKWWDTVVKCSNPKLLLIRPYEQQVRFKVMET